MQQHLIRQHNVFLHENGHAVQRVEEKMRIHLHPQSIELSARELCLEVRCFHFELRCASLTFAVAAVIVERLIKGDQHDVEQKIRLKLCEEEITELLPRPKTRRRVDYQYARDKHIDAEL